MVSAWPTSDRVVRPATSSPPQTSSGSALVQLQARNNGTWNSFNSTPLAIASVAWPTMSAFELPVGVPEGHSPPLHRVSHATMRRGVATGGDTMIPSALAKVYRLSKVPGLTPLRHSRSCVSTTALRLRMFAALPALRTLSFSRTVRT